VSPAGFRDVVDTKLVGCFLMAREVVPLMLRQGSGRIVNISMNEETMIRRGFVPYGPSGAGVEALSRIMAPDLVGPPIVWLASSQAAGVHARRIVASEFSAPETDNGASR